MSVEGAQKLNDRPVVLTRAVAIKPLWRPELGRELHPCFGAFEKRLDIRLFSVGLLDVVARLAADEVRGA